MIKKASRIRREFCMPGKNHSRFPCHMKNKNMRHYLLDPMEVELLACYRILDEQTKLAVIALITSQVDFVSHKLDECVEIQLVRR